MKLLIAALLVVSLSTAFGQVSISEFTDHAQYQDVRISPKGTYLAYTIEKEDGDEYLRVVTADAALAPISETKFSNDTGVQNFFWANDERIIISPTRKFRGSGALGFNQPTGEIFGINADGSNFEVLFGIAAHNKSIGAVGGQERVLAAGSVIDILPDEPDWIIIQSIPYSLEGDYTQSYKMNIKTGRRKNLKSSPIKNATFTTDVNRDIRFAVGVNKENVSELYYLNDNNEWEFVVNSDDEENWVRTEAPWGKDGKMLVSSMSSNRTTGISVWDPETNEVEVVFQNDTVDFSGGVLDHDGNLWAISYNDHYPEYFYPDESHPLVSLHKSLRSSFPNMDVRIVSSTEKMDKVVIFISGPENAGDFVVLDVSKMQYLTRLPVYPNLLEVKLARTDPIEFTTRDGMVIRGFITMPPNKEEKNLPLILSIHGGPHGIYDAWGYDVQNQILAQNGYMVLQVNFRGSGGRGKDFEEAGYRQWGAEIQNDLTDATQWVIAQGLADPDRICALGSSFGAYSALTSAYREPDLYKCVVGISGVYDLNLMFVKGDTQEFEQGVNILETYLGTDEEELKRFSPTEHADQISASVLLIHGLKDVRAPIKHARLMRDALEKEGNPAQWYVLNDEAHSLGSEENRIETYQNVLSFLEENIGK